MGAVGLKSFGVFGVVLMSITLSFGCGKAASTSASSTSESAGISSVDGATAIISYSVSPNKPVYIPGDSIQITATCTSNPELADIDWDETSSNAGKSRPILGKNTWQFIVPFIDSGKPLKMLVTGRPKSVTTKNGVANVSGNFSLDLPFDTQNYTNAEKLQLTVSPDGGALTEGGLISYSVTPNLANIHVTVSGPNIQASDYTLDSLQQSVQLNAVGSYSLKFSFANQNLTKAYTVSPKDYAYKTIKSIGNLTDVKLIMVGSTLYLVYQLDSGALSAKTYTGSDWVSISAPGFSDSINYRLLSDGSSVMPPVKTS